MNKYKIRSNILIVVCIIIGIIGFSSMIFCGLNIDWYQNMMNAEYISVLGFIISIIPTVLCGFISVFVVLKIGCVACDYENANDILRQFYKDALRGRKIELMNQKIVEDKLENIGYSRVDNYEFCIYHLTISRVFKIDISSFAIVVNDRYSNIEHLYSLITNHLTNHSLNISESGKRSKLCIFVLYFGNFDKKFLKIHTRQNIDDDVIINSIIYDNKTRCVYMFNPNKIYSKTFQKLSVSFLSLYDC